VVTARSRRFALVAVTGRGHGAWSRRFALVVVTARGHGAWSRRFALTTLTARVSTGDRAAAEVWGVTDSAEPARLMVSRAGAWRATDPGGLARLSRAESNARDLVRVVQELRNVVTSGILLARWAGAAARGHDDSEARRQAGAMG
jgi:hypothetical protein